MASKPTRIDGDRYLVPVESDIQVAALNEAKPDILAHLQKALRNGAIDFEPRISETEPSPLTWNSREVLQHILTTHPHLADLLREFSFSLA